MKKLLVFIILMNISFGIFSQNQSKDSITIQSLNHKIESLQFALNNASINLNKCNKKYDAGMNEFLIGMVSSMTGVLFGSCILLARGYIVNFNSNIKYQRQKNTFREVFFCFIEKPQLWSNHFLWLTFH